MSEPAGARSATRIAGSTEIGPRPANEDAYVVASDEEGCRLLLAVADGVGGRSRGDLASTEALRVLRARFEEVRTGGHEATREWLGDVFRQANDAVLRLREREDVSEQPSTTLVAGILVEESLRVANVGDSRAYVVTARAAEQISEDHSLISEAVRDGRKVQEIQHLPNAVTRYLGAEDWTPPDVFERTVTPGSVVLLCTDGLTGSDVEPVLDDEDLRHGLLEAHSLEAGLGGLTRTALKRGGTDNVTIAATEVGGFPWIEEARWAWFFRALGRTTWIQRIILLTIVGLVVALIVLLGIVLNGSDDRSDGTQVMSGSETESSPGPPGALRILHDDPVVVRSRDEFLYWSFDDGTDDTRFEVRIGSAAAAGFREIAVERRTGQWPHYAARVSRVVETGTDETGEYEVTLRVKDGEPARTVKIQITDDSHRGR